MKVMRISGIVTAFALAYPMASIASSVSTDNNG
jgi:hypothetical protein